MDRRRVLGFAAIAAGALWATWLPVEARAADMTGVAPVAPVSVARGTPLEAVLARLPKTTTVSVAGGNPVSVDLTWSLSEYVETTRGHNVVRQKYDPEVRGAYEMTGTFRLPDGVVRTDPSLPLEVKARVGVGNGPIVTFDDKKLFDQPGKYVNEKLKFGDVERTYHYYLPSTYTGEKPLPVMLTYHGAGSHGIAQIAYSEWDVVAEKEGIIVVAPDYGRSALGQFPTPGVSQFTSAILDELGKKLKIDERRIYASGISMGGGASFTLAQELGNRIAAVAPVAAGARGLLQKQLPRPITIVWFYGTRDQGYGPDVMATLDYLVKQDKTSAQPEVKVWTPTEKDPTGITRLTYGGGTDGTEIVFYRIDEGGHTWPGKYQYASLISVGLTSQHIDATQVIWDHLKKHSLPKK